MTSAAATASDYFGAMVASYDSLIRRAVPRYDEMTDRLLEYSPQSDAVGRILELGCGTGNLTLRLAQRYPQATVTAVDAAPEMTALTASRVAAAGWAARLTTLTRRFEDLDFPDASFDLVSSCMSLHHIRDKGHLYRAFARWVVPGGALCFADQVLGATGAIQAVNWDRWLAFCRQPGHCSPEELEGLIDHAAAHDHYTPLQEHFRLLGEAGFRALDCVWRNGMYGVVTAQRSRLDQG